MNDFHMYVEQRDDGRYSARWGNATRVSAITDTQGEAIKLALQIGNGAPVHVERVRHTDKGDPDKWRHR